MNVRTLIDMPRTARRGDVLNVRVMISHPMETGYRRGSDGDLLPRDIIGEFSCSLDGKLLFGARLHPAISANPYLSFQLRAESSGELVFRWQGDRGFVHTERVQLTVS